MLRPQHIEEFRVETTCTPDDNTNQVCPIGRTHEPAVVGLRDAWTTMVGRDRMSAPTRPAILDVSYSDRKRRGSAQNRFCILAP